MKWCRLSSCGGSPASRRSAAGFKLGMSPQERMHDQTDQLLISESFEPGKKAQIGVLGIESRERIDLDEVRLSMIVAADIDATAVAAAKHAPCAHRDIGGSLGLCILDQPVDDVFVTAFLVLEAVIETRG